MGVTIESTRTLNPGLSLIFDDREAARLLPTKQTLFDDFQLLWENSAGYSDHCLTYLLDETTHY